MDDIWLSIQIRRILNLETLRTPRHLQYLIPDREVIQKQSVTALEHSDRIQHVLIPVMAIHVEQNQQGDSILTQHCDDWTVAWYHRRMVVDILAGWDFE